MGALLFLAANSNSDFGLNSEHEAVSETLFTHCFKQLPFASSTVSNLMHNLAYFQNVMYVWSPGKVGHEQGTQCTHMCDLYICSKTRGLGSMTSSIITLKLCSDSSGGFIPQSCRILLHRSPGTISWKTHPLNCLFLREALRHPIQLMA